MKQLLGRIPCSEAGNGGCRTRDMPGSMGRISNQDSFAERNHLKGQAKRGKTTLTPQKPTDYIWPGASGWPRPWRWKQCVPLAKDKPWQTRRPGYQPCHVGPRGPEWAWRKCPGNPLPAPMTLATFTSYRRYSVPPCLSLPVILKPAINTPIKQSCKGIIRSLVFPWHQGT